jgi:hypothetical protein
MELRLHLKNKISLILVFKQPWKWTLSIVPVIWMLELRDGSHLVPKIEPNKFDFKFTWVQNWDLVLVKFFGTIIENTIF